MLSAPQRRTSAMMSLLFLVPVLHPLLRPLVGVPSHLLWFVHVLPVAWLTYHHGRRTGAVSIATCLTMVVVGERTLGAGYFVPADWQTAISLAVSLGFTSVLVGGFASYARRARTLQEQLWHSQKMETLGLFAASVAHDFNNMLTAITLSTEMTLEEMAAGDPRRHHIGEIPRAAERAAMLSKRLLAFSRRDVSQPAELNVADVIRGLESMMRRLISPSVELLVDTDQVPDVVSDRGHLEQIVMNLVVNANDAIPSRGMITITTRLAVPQELPLRHDKAPPREYVLLEVRDTGVGMDEELQHRIFEPLFTTKPPGKGTGLGLSTVKDLVTAWQGLVTVSSSVGRGSVFRVLLPVPLASPPAHARAAWNSRELGIRLAS